MKIVISCFLLYLASAGTIFAGENGGTVRPGEYQLVFSQPSDTKLIRKTFSSFEVVYVQPLGANAYLMRLKSDPGKNKIEFIAKTLPNFRTISVNNVYQIK
ncbi:MAG: hypothetical protein IME93_03545 [Proteobacteria bacterium]|nr:hypothetical protein [Pseudomonadota bacterium]